MTNDRHIKTAVVTGAAGFIGRYLLVELTREGTHVCALVRNPVARLPELRAWVDAHGGNGSRLAAADFDLEAADLGLTPDGEAWLDRADAVFHLAARFEFGLSAEAARVANVDASLRLVERVARSPRLERLVYLSGYRTEGGPARALDVDDPAALRRFYRDHGAYEASKMEAHQRVARRAEELGVPLTRVSPAVVIGHSQTGETTQFIGLVGPCASCTRVACPPSRETPARGCRWSPWTWWRPSWPVCPPTRARSASTWWSSTSARPRCPTW
ncbi:MAG: SDR family oxidoreductase [Sandaracinaceae bacterium]|nr:SDR family oxidoreductase [Sandaracinaceae bacterium]